MNKWRDKWEQLNPKVKQRIILVLVIFIFLFFIFVYTSNKETKIKHTENTNPIKNISTDILTGRDTSNLGVEGNANSIRKLRSTIDNLNDQIDQFMKKTHKEIIANNPRDLEKKITQLNTEVMRLRRDYKERANTAFKMHNEFKRNQGHTSNKTVKKEQPVFKPVVAPSQWAVTPSQKVKAAAQGASPQQQDDKIKIKVIAEKITPAEKKKIEAQKNKKNTLFVPAGSIISGTLITGMDAPTNDSTKGNPFPTLLRIKDETILPNRFKMNLRECFIIASGYGDLSSERAYVRGETISCINNKKEILESPIDLYAVGEDGKIGIRGRLVSKNGQVLARALAAGFMQGISEAFKPQPIAQLNTTPGSSVQFQNPLTGQAATSALLNGTSKALDRLSKYYIKLAEGIFPVIEVDAGRKIDMIVKKGTRLTFMKKD